MTWRDKYLNEVVCGDALDVLKDMRNSKGQFIKGVRSSPETEFKRGYHWRSRKLYWCRYWLRYNYIELGRSAAEIAKDFKCSENNIYYFLAKYGIPRRDISETRKIKYWGAVGTDNPMYGRIGIDNPNWKGGITPERQAFHQSREWKSAVKKVWRRDKGICQRCGIKNGGLYRGVAFHIHHIADFSHKKLRANPDNLVLLCFRCHRWVHSRANKERKWVAE